MYPPPVSPVGAGDPVRLCTSGLGADQALLALTLPPHDPRRRAVTVVTADRGPVAHGVWGPSAGERGSRDHIPAVCYWGG